MLWPPSPERGAVMPRRQGPGLSLAEWLVLCLVREEPAHGFALAARLAPDGDMGMIWHVRKAVVYRAAQRLERLGLITAEDKQYSRLGPPRSRLSVTPRGDRAAAGWLRQPVPIPVMSAPNCCPSWPCCPGRRRSRGPAAGPAPPVRPGSRRARRAAAHRHRVRPGAGPVAARIGRRDAALPRCPPGRHARPAGRDRSGRGGPVSAAPGGWRGASRSARRWPRTTSGRRMPA